ncbi:MAG: hypothetical protein ACD_15C00028G0001 [uncultured bacterium]|nr:MAG: hypothetical protein ACD_15C00028G0001 [uncultured bacterium]HCU70145.1 hypothetical protein [Candidatus Moranbacteria bacterium]
MQRYLVAKVAIFGRTSVNCEKPTLCIIEGETAKHYIGRLAARPGIVNIKFPKETTRELTSGEKERLRFKVVVNGRSCPGGKAYS